MTTLPIWLAVTVPLLVAVIGVGATVSGQVVAGRHQRKVKRMELDHAESIKRIEAENKRQEQLREERIKAYTSFLRGVVLTVKEGDADSIFQALDRLYTAVAAVDILASPPVSKAADKLLHTMEETKGQNEALLKQCREEFLRAAQEELGVRLKVV